MTKHPTIQESHSENESTEPTTVETNKSDMKGSRPIQPMRVPKIFGFVRVLVVLEAKSKTHSCHPHTDVGLVLFSQALDLLELRIF